jgi:cytochrome c553
MKQKASILLALLCGCLLGGLLISAQETPSAPPAPPVPPSAQPLPPASPRIPPRQNPLVWDGMEKVFKAKPGDSKTEFIFWVTNTSKADVIINNVSPSCGCTVAQLPSTPWKLGPGQSGDVHATIDFMGKTGTSTKTMTVTSSAGMQTLMMKLEIPTDADTTRRAQNMMLAKNDRQAVFKNDCASCHVTPLKGKTGEELFKAGCNICHDPDTGHRASIVPDLKTLTIPTDANYWRAMISNGKEGTLMPAFAQKHGGPLTDPEIESLVEYAVKTFKFDPANLKKEPSAGK